jgi:hypothetical protein
LARVASLRKAMEAAGGDAAAAGVGESKGAEATEDEAEEGEDGEEDAEEKEKKRKAKEAAERLERERLRRRREEEEDDDRSLDSLDSDSGGGGTDGGDDLDDDEEYKEDDDESDDDDDNDSGGAGAGAGGGGGWRVGMKKSKPKTAAFGFEEQGALGRLLRAVDSCDYAPVPAEWSNHVLELGSPDAVQLHPTETKQRTKVCGCGRVQTLCRRATPVHRVHARRPARMTAVALRPFFPLPLSPHTWDVRTIRR